MQNILKDINPNAKIGKNVEIGNFTTIYDDVDTKRLIRLICIDLNINTKIFPENWAYCGFSLSESILECM